MRDFCRLIAPFWPVLLWIAAVVAIVTTVAVLSTPVRAAEGCPPGFASGNADIMRALQVRNGRAPVWVGLTSRNSVFEIWAAADGFKRWLAIETFSDGSACSMASGEGWETVFPWAIGH